MWAASLYLTLTLCVFVQASAKSCRCPPGYAQIGPSICEPCKPGTYQPSVGGKRCLPCPSTTTSSFDLSIKCRPCGPNSNASKNRRDKCACHADYGPLNRRGGKFECQVQRCPPGKEVSDNDEPAGELKCLNCFSGTFKSKGDGSRCIKCPKGSLALVGAIKCIVCPKGEILIEKDVCGVCPAGTYPSYAQNSEYAFDYFTACFPCSSTSFKDKPGNFNCKRCPEGTSGSNRDRTKCITCPVGMSLNDKGICERICDAKADYKPSKDECVRREPCPPNTGVGTSSGRCVLCTEMGLVYSKEKKKCVKCPHGKVFITKLRGCGTCPPGTVYDYFRSKGCVSCRSGTYSEGGVNRNCRKCPVDTSSERKDSSCKKCPSGTMYIKKLGKCGVCKAGFFYIGGQRRCKRCRRGFTTQKPGIRMECPKCPSSPEKAKQFKNCRERRRIPPCCDVPLPLPVYGSLSRFKPACRIKAEG